MFKILTCKNSITQTVESRDLDVFFSDYLLEVPMSLTIEKICELSVDTDEYVEMSLEDIYNNTTDTMFFVYLSMSGSETVKNLVNSLILNKLLNNSYNSLSILFLNISHFLSIEETTKLFSMAFTKIKNIGELILLSKSYDKLFKAKISLISLSDYSKNNIFNNTSSIVSWITYNPDDAHNIIQYIDIVTANNMHSNFNFLSGLIMTIPELKCNNTFLNYYKEKLDYYVESMS